jgi:citrate synthase
MQEEMRQLSPEEAPGRSGKTAGYAAATRAPSAAAIAKILSGVDFPKKKEELVRHAKENKQKVDASEEIIQVIHQLPERTYSNMADVEKALAEVR